MSKYSNDELKEMAQECVVDRTAGGEKSFNLIMVISMVTGLSPTEIVDRIEALADA